MTQDLHSRPLRSLRISVTDRCNLRCRYCMPEADYTWLPRAQLLSFEEIDVLARAFIACGVRRIRLTGGEPLLRRDLPQLVQLLTAHPELDEVALTTNGVRLAQHLPALKDAGLTRVTVSLDTLRPDRFHTLSRRHDLPAALDGLRAAHTLLPHDLKIDTVVLRDLNDDELPQLLDFAGELHAEIRFIEYMDVGGATSWSPRDVVSRQEILSRITASHGTPTPLPHRGSAPAERFQLPNQQTFGIIASTTTPFCGACDRSRLTADGRWLLCLYAHTGIDLRTPLRQHTTNLQDLIQSHWSQRDDRGAERRLPLASSRGPLLPASSLKNDPHAEMHTRGG